MAFGTHRMQSKGGGSSVVVVTIPSATKASLGGIAFHAKNCRWPLCWFHTWRKRTGEGKYCSMTGLRDVDPASLKTDASKTSSDL